MPNGSSSIVDLDAVASRLPADALALFNRLFRVTISEGQLDPPEAMKGWITKLFGSVEAVKNQKIVKVTNLITFEESLFNDLRAKRPIEAKEAAGLRQTIDESRGDPFCKPLEGTPADVFGRVQGAHSITASNIAKYDGFHGVVIFEQHDPLDFNEEDVKDYITTSVKWLDEAHAYDPSAIYPFIMWNCLWKSGASILHGHFQVTLGRGSHYGKIENLRMLANAYGERHSSNYYEDLWQIHKSLGLGVEWSGVRAFAYLAPIKEKEVFFIANAIDENLKTAIYRVVNSFVKDLGVTSFNMVIYMPPLVAQPDWKGFPIMVRLVDRGDPLNKTADMGAMELYAASVISSDPFRVGEAVQRCFA
jgi:hypothetical protein